jgi:hypothetical protein
MELAYGVVSDKMPFYMSICGWFSLSNSKDTDERCRSIALAMDRSDNFTLLFSTGETFKDTARKLTTAVNGSVYQIVDLI